MANLAVIDPSKTPLYYILPAANLPAVLANGFILSHRLVTQVGGPAVNASYGHIQERRGQKLVPSNGRQRLLSSFVPFYFCPRSPMLYTINLGNTGRPKGFQSEILHLATTMQIAMSIAQGWAFSDVGGGAAYVSFFNDLQRLDQLDWGIIQSDSWANRATQKSAEFLVPDRFPWTGILQIGCHNQEVADRIANLVANLAHRPQVTIQRGWYFQ